MGWDRFYYRQPCHTAPVSGGDHGGIIVNINDVSMTMTTPTAPTPPHHPPPGGGETDARGGEESGRVGGGGVEG